MLLHLLNSCAYSKYKTPDKVLFQSRDVHVKCMQVLQDSLRSLCWILHRVVCILYCTVLEMLPTTSRDTLKSSCPSLISSSNIWIACMSWVCPTGISVIITVSLKSLPAWKDMHKEIHFNKLNAYSYSFHIVCLKCTSRCLVLQLMCLAKNYCANEPIITIHTQMTQS